MSPERYNVPPEEPQSRIDGKPKPQPHQHGRFGVDPSDPRYQPLEHIVRADQRPCSTQATGITVTAFAPTSTVVLNTTSG